MSLKYRLMWGSNPDDSKTVFSNDLKSLLQYGNRLYKNINWTLSARINPENEIPNWVDITTRSEIPIKPKIFV